MKKDENNLKDIYNTFFTDYPDVLNIQQLSEILGGIGKKLYIQCYAMEQFHLIKLEILIVYRNLCITILRNYKKFLE